jgi:hypothetical protein
MEFIVNESGCRQLSADMLTNMREIAMLVSEIDSQNGTLRAALGDDYDAIARSVRIMTSELQNAHSELNVIINDMNEYMSRVHQARVSLD